MKGSENEGADQRPPLRFKEKEVLKLLSQGKTIAEIADAMMLVTFSVRTILRNMQLKLGFNSMVELRNYAREQEFL